MLSLSITCLGAGSGLTEKYYYNNYIFDLNAGERKMLVDAGTTILYSLRESKYELTDITDILITHFHTDHVGGLEEIAQRCKFMFNHKPNLWIREDQYAEFDIVVGNGLKTNGLTLLSYFNVYLFDVDEGFNILDYEIQTIRTDDLHSLGMPSFGFKVTTRNKNSVLFTGDIADISGAEFDKYIDDNTVKVFHDCSIVPSPVHAFIGDIISYYDEKVIPKFHMMHYQDNVDPDRLGSAYNCVFVTQGDEYKIN